MARPSDLPQKQLVVVPFTGGLETKSAISQVAPGKFLTLENIIRDRFGMLQKRYGFTALGNTTTTGGTLTKGSKLFEFQNELLLADQTSLYSYVSASNSWVLRGALGEVDVKKTPARRNTYSQTMLDVANCNGYTCYAYMESDPSNNNNLKGNRYTIVDDTTGAVIVQGNPVSGTIGVLLRVVAMGTKFYLVYMDNSGNLKLQIYDTATLVAGAEIDLATIGYIGTAWYQMDIAAMGTTGIVIAVATGAATFKIIEVLPTGAIGTGLNGLPAPISVPYDASLGISVITDNVNGWIFTVFSGPNAGTTASKTMVHCATYNLATTQVGIIEDTSLYTANSGGGGCPISAISQIQNNGNTVQVFYTLSNPLAIDHFTRTNTFTWNGAATLNIGTSTQVIRSIQVYSKPFKAAGPAATFRTYFIGAFETALQSTYYIIRDDGSICGKISPSIGGGLQRTKPLTGFALSFPTSVVKNSAGNFLSAVQSVSKFVAASNGSVYGSTYSADQVILTTESSKFTSAVLGQNLLIAGAAPKCYDGTTVAEAGFFHYPEGITGVVAAGTSSFPSAGAYAYRFIYQWTDARGQVHRSAPSTSLSQTIAATTNKITLTCPKLRLTEKSPTNVTFPNWVRVVIYRSDVNAPTIFYKLVEIPQDGVSVGNWTWTNDQLTFVDDNTSGVGLTSREILYTTGGVYDNTPPVPCSVLWHHRNRIYMISGEDPDRVYYSRSWTSGESVNFSDLNYFSVDSFGGHPTALGTLDDKLVICKKSNIFTMSGDGPLDTGAQNDFTIPELIATDVGCSNMNSICVAEHGNLGGLIFKSDKGIYLLNRMSRVEYIGASVDGYNSLTISSASIMDAKNELRFTTSDGATLIYNYLYDQWSIFTNYTSVDALWSNNFNTYLHLTSDGKVHKEIAGQYNDNGTLIQMAIETAWMAMGNVQGFQRVYWINVLGEFVSNHTASLAIAYNYENTYNQTKTFVTSSGMAGSSVFQYRIKPNVQKCESIKLRMTDIDSGSGGGSVNLTGLALVVGVKSGAMRLSPIKTIGV